MTTETLMTEGQTPTDADVNAAPAAEAAPATEATEEVKADEAATEKTEAPKAPETYEDFIAPEGKSIDTEVGGELKALAKELNLSQEQAQKFADLGFKMSDKWQASLQEAQAQAVQEWASEVKADKEIGGDKLNENLAVAKKALNQFGSPELTQMLNDTGLGNHPELVRAFYKAGKAISEDKFVPAKSAPGTIQDRASKLYPNMPQG